jgi:HD-GYP domain-containing protein (c-di-GMP phosphodiesterase class II)
MEIKVSQLVPGCILTEDVIGKTRQPIISKDTVITSEHILILKRFLIHQVKVSTTLANGKSFGVKVNEFLNEEQIKQNQKLSFQEHYDHALIQSKHHFSQWQNNMPINIPEIRQFLLPLFESAEEIGIEVYKLYQHVTAEDYLYHHSISLGILSSFLARKVGYEKGESIQIGLAGFLSNVGMAKIDPRIITKGESLTETEKEEIKDHPKYSYLAVQSVQTITDAVKLAILQHHERLDGSGYPIGIIGDKIHKYARIVAICDTYNSMTSDRLYMKGKSSFKAMNELEKSQFGKLDLHITQVFVQSFVSYSLGEKVQLSNAQIGRITFIDRRTLTSPVILLEDNDEILSLEDHQNVSIVDFI